MTDNDVLFKTGQDETRYGFQLQPVYAPTDTGISAVLVAGVSNIPPGLGRTPGDWRGIKSLR
jgi:hypothetical protein